MRLSDAIGLELERREKIMTFEEWWKTRHKDRRLYMKDESRAAWNHQQARIEALEEVPAIVCVVAALQAYGYTIPSGWVLPTTHKSPYWEQCWRKALLEGE